MKLLRALWREAGALWILMLVFNAGALNAAGFLRYGEVLSPMTGNLTLLGLSFSGLAAQAGMVFAVILISFFAGATLSGYGFPDHSAGLWRRSGAVLMLGGTLLLLAEVLPLPKIGRIAILAMVLGGQNGLALRYRGNLTRTTHMTGHMTDCGAALGRMIHNRSWQGDNLKRFLFHLSCVLFFLSGAAFTGLSTSWLQHRYSMDIVNLVAILYLLSGAGTYARGLRAYRASA